jgi:hypothetical protein
MQEETTFLDVPCLTVRENIARPVTITMGTNQLVGRDLQKLRNVAAEILSQRSEGGTRKYETNRERQPCRIPLGDGHAAERIAEIISATRKFDEELSNVRAPQRPVQAEFGLELRAGVGVDFAVQANFFKSGCSPLHDFSPMSFRASLPRNVP